MDAKVITRPSRPQSVKELVSQAENFNFNINIPFKHWTRAAETLYQEVSQFSSAMLIQSYVHFESSCQQYLHRPLLRYRMALMAEHT